MITTMHIIVLSIVVVLGVVFLLNKKRKPKDTLETRVNDALKRKKDFSLRLKKVKEKIKYESDLLSKLK